MRTIPRNATKKIAAVAEIISAEWLIEFTRTGDFPNYTYKATGAMLAGDAFAKLTEHKEARLVEHVSGKLYTITYGGTPRVRSHHVITLVKTPEIRRDMKGITYTQPDGTTMSADVSHMWIQLDSGGVPQILAEIEYDGIEAVVPIDRLSPERWVFQPTAEYLAEQAAIEAAYARAEQEEEETTCRDCASPLGNGARDGRCARCADQADADQATDTASEESAGQVKAGDTVHVADMPVTVVRRAYVTPEHLVIMFRHKTSTGRELFGVSDHWHGGTPSIVDWPTSQRRAETRFVEWCEAARWSGYDTSESEAEKFSVDMLGIFTVSVPATDAESARARVAELFDNGAEFDHVTGTDSYGQEFKDVRLTAISGRGEPAVVDNDEQVRDPEYVSSLTDSAKRELRELVDAYREAADGPSGDDEHDAANALADAVAALLGD